jgi:hypothetical protein
VTALINLVRFYLQKSVTLPMKIWLMDGGMPYPQWPDADIVFVLNPPPLDIPVIAEVWKPGRTLVLVSKKIDSNLAEKGVNPIAEFFALPDNTTIEVLTHLRNHTAAVFFMSFQIRRPWYINWFPQQERDAFVVDGKHFMFQFDEYTPYEDSFEFDDAYRRISLKECTFAQSTNHFLHTLERLPYTAIEDAQTKQSLFRGIFPFYNTGQPLGPDIHFDWQGTPEPVRTAVIGADIRKHTPVYALALACLSKVGAAFTHRGRHDLYLNLLGDQIQLQNGRIKAGTFTQAQRNRLRKEYPFLYLHVFYRVPNHQFIVATLDEIRDSLLNAEIMAAAEDLLQRLVTCESALHFVKRTYELTALSGTLCQLKTFAARYHSDRSRLLAAKEDGLRAMQHARPNDLSRDINYWIQAVLTDWVLFSNEVQQSSSETAEEYQRMVEYLRGHLHHERDNSFNWMVVYLAGAVESVYLKEKNIIDLLSDCNGGPEVLNDFFQHKDYDEKRIGTYALCLAAGYAILLVPTMKWRAESLAVPMEKAYQFFFDRQTQHSERTDVILRILAIKYAACRLFYLHTRQEFEKIAQEASTYLAKLQDLTSHLMPHETLVRFFQKAQVQPEKLHLPEVLKAVITLPY